LLIGEARHLNGPGQDPVEATFQHAGDIFDWLQPRADRPGIPAIKKCSTANCFELPRPQLHPPSSVGVRTCYLKETE